ncbi:MAG TPA: hypothetical protein VH255_06880, partial [Verrucomicrobiae bacterium]|nr:hypothetical protein [Verrucomicrobiae bacterium]
WKATPQSALQSKSFPSGYAMQIQFGAIANGQLTGKIYLALPDPEKTVIAGIFNAATNLK